MDRDRWQRVRELFLRVCDVEPRERQSLLASLCGPDEQLYDEVGALLADSGEQSVLDGDPLEPAARDPLVGSHIGPYRLNAEIGRGGMGAIYRAERADDVFAKTVAIKLIRRELLDRKSIERFRTERQALALLEHPNIARLLDGGMGADGSPYLVMEYVQGQPICEYADAHRLETRARLALFRDVCRAVQYAHANLVVHRDLKPGNVLVTADGTVKLLDFGIAKVLAPEQVAGRAETSTRHRPFTPEYASPEQIRGEPLNTATDVYSLGVVLYELLSGRRPHPVRSVLVSEFEQAVLTSNPEPPSAAIRRYSSAGEEDGGADRNATPELVSAARGESPRRLSRRLRGDLDNIVLRAMRKQPGRRYASVQELADDIDNYLDSRPVRARPDSLAYRTVRFVQRHYLSVGVALLLLAAAVTGTVLVHMETRRATRERDKANAVVAFLRDIISTADPDYGGAEVPIRRVIENASARIGVEFPDQPEVRALLQQTIGSCCFALGLYEDAVRNLRAATEGFRSLPGDHVGDYLASANILSNALYAGNHLDEAEEVLVTALEVCLGHFGPRHEMTAQTENNLGIVLYKSGNLERAEELLQQSLETRQRLLGPDHLSMAETLNNLAAIARARGDLDAAVALARRAFDIRAAALHDRHPLVIQSLGNLALFLHLQGDLAEAAPMYRRALSRSREVLGEDHPDGTYIAGNLAGLLSERGDFAEAEQLLHRSLRIRRQKFPAHDPRTLRTAFRLGRCYADQEKYAEASALLLSIRRECESASTPAHDDLDQRAAEALARVHEARERPQDAAK